jgi:putative phage-type endonuclease
MIKKLIWTEEELKQGSPEWFAWRKGDGDGRVEFTLGGSEIAPLMYMSPYATPREVYRWKMGLDEKVFSDAATEAMERGNLLEPVARAHYAKTFGSEVRTLCAIHPKFPWMRTSLDGITEDNRVLLEIKSPRSLDNHVKQTKGHMLPAYRYPQLQWQLAVMREHYANVERVDYISFWADIVSEPFDPEADGPPQVGNIDMTVIPIYPNEEFISELMRRGEIFVNEYLRPGIEPPANLFIEELPLIVQYPKPKKQKDIYWTPGVVTI